ncbi:amino acid adenylation domain-containing protein [Streptomyces sp. NPDC050485]|uniref:amino acid adenylation domain-containing protein n=1 Tax=Streptomyces sp. NPDC050485 TaxID=3365617 RepID=UPI0037A65F17
MPGHRTIPHSIPEQPSSVRGQNAAVPKADRAAPLVPSFAQQRLWFLAQLAGASEAYHMPLALHLQGPLNSVVLSRSLDALVARHEVLRTRLVAVAGEAFQRIDPPGTGFALRFHDLSGLPDGASQLTALQREEATEPFDLARGPLVRGRLVALAPDRHVLLLTMHHIVSDGWSMGVLTKELGALYAAFQQDGPNPLAPLRVQYADYAAWQRQLLSDGALAAQSAYWREALAGAPALLELPTDRPRPAEQDYRGEHVRITLGAELTAALHAFSRRHRSTLFMTVLTGWALTLSRLSGQHDVVIGTPVANRRRTELEELIGFFVNTLALRIDLSGAPSVAELLKRVRGVALSALKHQDLPFEQVVELANPSRTLAHTPLFQVMFAWQNNEAGELTLPDIEVTGLDSPSAAAKFDLALSLGEEDGRIVGSLDYADALFDRETAERYGRYLTRVLEQMAEEPDREATSLSLLDERERRQVLVDWNDTARPVSKTGLVERFEAQVRLHPDQLALACADERLDYAAIDRRANRLAHALLARGVHTDQLVGLHTGRSAELVVGVLGILKAGAAYLPLDPGLPAERLTGMVADAAPALVLSDAATPAADWHALTAVEAEGRRDDAPGIAAAPADLAYVIYTSGSTGRPKGVAVTHGNVVNLFDHWLDRIGAAPGEAASMWSSIGFDASVHEILLPLTTGAALHLVPEELRGDPEALMDWLRTHRIAQAFLPPAFIKWIDEDPRARLDGVALRQLLTGVESLPEAALHRMTRLLPGLRVLYGYGPTETTLYSTAYFGPQPLARQCPIGKPIANTRVYLLDERLEPVPIGVPGELYIAGAGVARGYLGRPDLTAERFLADPFVPGERMYRTGDLARRLADGNAEYIGRRDHQVKLRGFRIELGEVEAALLDEPGVYEAAVFADRAPTGEQRLVAAVGRSGSEPVAGRSETETTGGRGVSDPAGGRGKTGPAGGRTDSEPTGGRTESGPAGARGEPRLSVGDRETEPAPDRSAIEPRPPAHWRAALSRRLPDYMIPALFIELPRLPQTPNGKVDRTALLELARTGGPAQVNQASPRDLIELTLYQIWQRLLLQPEIGIRDSFFDIGGSSISAIKLAHAIREAFGETLPVRDIIQHPTIEALGGRLREGAGGPPPSNLIEFRAGDSAGRVVCVHPAGGTAFCYLSLAKALPDSVGVYGIQSPGVNPGESFLPTVEAMAEEYLRLIEPLLDGPLVLTGLSYGGLVAHEMGRRLALAGRAEPSVVLLDTQATGDPVEQALVEPVEMAEFRDKLVKFNGMYPGIEDRQIDQYFHLYNHNRLTARDHRPAHSKARLVLVQAVGGAPESAGPVRAFWQSRADGGLLVEPLDCDHWEVLENPALPRVAALLDSELTRLRTAGQLPPCADQFGPDRAQEA